MTNETKTEEVQMTLVEAANLFDRSWLTRKDELRRQADYNSTGDNVFMVDYKFKPFDLSELAQRLPHLKSQRIADHYSSGRAYVARKAKGRIEIRPVEFVRTSDWKEKAPKKYDIVNILLESPNAKISQTPIYSFFTNQDFLNLEKVADFGERKAFYLSGEQASLSEISELPIWKNKDDFEKFMRAIYDEGQEGKEAQWFSKNLREGRGFYVTDPRAQLTDKWSLVTTVLSPGTGRRWCFDTIPLFRGFPVPGPDSQKFPNNYREKLCLMGAIKSPDNWKLRDCSLEGHLLNTYVQPTDIGNGVTVLNNDRIPLYLQRRLGIGGNK